MALREGVDLYRTTKRLAQRYDFDAYIVDYTGTAFDDEDDGFLTGFSPSTREALRCELAVKNIRNTIPPPSAPPPPSGAP